ncbi:cation transporter [Pedobacter hartonius]|uniref:cation transporter n=1 Tax=Pedobacter hartonius TaxID=425514 RepID=UPI000B88D57F
MIGAAAWITWLAIYFIQTPHALPNIYTLGVLVVVVVVKESVFRYVMKVGKRLNSKAVKADAYHHRRSWTVLRLTN